MVSEQNKSIVSAIRSSGLNTYKALRDYLDMAREISDSGGDNDLDFALRITREIKEIIPKMPLTQEFNDLYWQVLKFEAPHRFESFLYYMEKNRAPEKRFYQPRAKTLKIVVDDLQDLEDGLIDFYGLSLPPRVGKSTICIFFLAWIIGKRPNSHSAMSGHSGLLADGFYNEIYNLTTSEEYTFSEIFPEVKLQKKSADKMELNYDKPDRFATLTCRGIDGTWTGSVDISPDGYLYVDDLVRDRTESLSPTRLENRYQDYLNVLVDRKNDGARELMVGTRWNILDPLGKVEANNKDNPRYRFRKIPALNENGESNFNYDYGKGFSTKYYTDLKNRLDKNEWEAKYQQRPFVREGLLFPESALRTYNGVLPDGGLVRKLFVCDVAWGGGDSLSAPFGYLYEDGSVYIPKWIFNKGDKKVTKPLVVGNALHYQPNQMHFEADNGGHEYADDIDRQLQEKNFKTNITSKKADNKSSKLARIIQYAPDVKENFVFLDKEHRDKEYQDAMDEFTMFVQIGDNEHDDAPDAITQMAAFLSGGIYAKCEAVERPY